MIKYLLSAAGFICIGLAAVGIIFPVWPTTPFLLLAAYLFSKSSPRMHEYLMNNRHFGPTLRNYYEHRGIKSSTRIFAILLMWAVLVAAIILFIPFDWAKVSVIIIGIMVSIYLFSLKTL
jgi:uncharacterized protein